MSDSLAVAVPDVARPPAQAIRHRLVVSLVATVMRSGVSFVAGLLVARALGPASYGVMVFLLGTAQALRALFDGGTSTAFFTLHAQRQRSRRFNAWYFLWLTLQLLVPVLVIYAVLPDDAVARLWKGQTRGLVALAYIASFAQMVLWSTFSQMGEAKRLTRQAQTTAAGVALVHLGVAAVAWRTGWISVPLMLTAIALEWTIATVLMWMRLDYPAAAAGEDSLRQVAGEFLHFCVPLVPYAAASFAYEFADRWLLQTYGGSVQQGYYAAALQFGAVGALANAAVTNIFWKEIAEAHYEQRTETVARLHRKMTRGLFFVAAAIAGFLIPWARELVALTLGPAYQGGVTTFAIMLFYPVHQTQGQTNGTTAFATKSLTGYTVINACGLVLGVGVTYLMVAPASAPIPGFGLASTGLAMKMVGVQVVIVNLVSHYLARRLHIAYDWVYQPVVAVATIGAGALAHVTAVTVAGAHMSIWTGVPIAGVVYALLLGTLIWRWPSLAGTTRDELMSVRHAASMFHS